ncbi:MAG: hypothetical protein ISS12_10020 [Candidatus Marinimicrobia bacterium]|nr:hypothetical protein [Candidatus Neomarinimicrobiota bacterium]
MIAFTRLSTSDFGLIIGSFYGLLAAQSISYLFRSNEPNWSDAAQAVDAKYPVFEDSLTSNTIDMIRATFPGVEDELLAAHIDTIISLYQAVKKYDLLVTLKDYVKPNNLGKVADYIDYPGGLNSQEFWLLFWHASMIAGTVDGTNTAIDQTADEYPGENGWLTPADAFRHTAWNSLIAKKTGSHHTTVSAANAWAKSFTDAHENGDPEPENELDNPMDFHNNHEGRDYFTEVGYRQRVKWYWFFGWHYKYVVKGPSDSNMQSAVASKVDDGTIFTSIDDLDDLDGTLVWIVAF